jgi:protein CMS1
MATSRGATILTAETRALRPFQTKESIVGKLFAKHIKLEEAKQFLQRARYGFMRTPLPIRIIQTNFCA